MDIMKRVKNILNHKNDVSSSNTSGKSSNANKSASASSARSLSASKSTGNIRFKSAESENSNHSIHNTAVKNTKVISSLKGAYIRLDNKGARPNSVCYHCLNGNNYLKLLYVPVDKKAKHHFYAMALVPSAKSAHNAANFTSLHKSKSDYSFSKDCGKSIYKYLRSIGLHINLQKYYYHLFATHSVKINGTYGLMFDFNSGFRKIRKFDK